MKKNFFKKKLASGLALALVVASLAPAGISAQAASNYIVKQGGAKAPTILYVGAKATDYGLKKTYKSNTYTWKVSNTKVAKINSKTGVVTPKAPGKVTITVTARNAKTKKWLKDFKLNVTVKQRATSVDIGAEDFTLAPGETKDLNAVKTPAKSTDVLVYTSSDENVAKVDAKTGVVTAGAAGEATITVYSKATSSSALTSKYNLTDSVKVTVPVGVKSVAQKSNDTIELAFNANVKDKVKASDIAIENAATHAVLGVKELSFSEDGTVVTAKTYFNFTDGATYTVTYAEKSHEFKASVGEVASVKINTTTVPFNEATEIKYDFYDANGIKITDTVDNNRVDVKFETTTGYTSFSGTATTLVLPNKGDTATVTVTYHTYKYENNSEVTVSAKTVVTAVDPTAITVGNYEKYTIAKDEPSDWNKVTANTKISLSELGQGYKVFLRVKNSADKYIDNSDIKFYSSNTDILMVDEDGTLHPVKEGTVYIIAKYNNNGGWTLPVTVVAERKANGLTLDKYNVTVSNSADADEKVTVTATLKDQFGDEIKDKAISATDVVAKTAPTSATNPDVTVDGMKVTFAGSGATEGTYTYVITLDGKSVSLTVKVVAPGAVKSEKLVMSANNIDVVTSSSSKESDITGKAVSFYVGKFGSNNALAGYVPLTKVSVTAPNGKPVDATGTTVSGASVTIDGDKVTFNAITKNDADQYVKAATGTYKVEVTANSKTYTSYIQVTDTTVAFNVKVEKLKLDNLNDATIEAAIKVKDTDGKELAIVSMDTVRTDSYVHVKSVTVVDNNKVLYTVNVGKTFTK